LRSSNRRIFAIGDVTGGPLFTHVAGYHAGIALRNALFRIPARTRLAALPWATYTDPELAQVGLRETEARAQHGDRIRVLRADFAANDRAVAECRGTGFLKVMTTRRGRIVGASIVGHGAGELLAPWTLALSAGLKIGDMAQVIAPYPTLSEISKRAAGTYYAPTLFGPRVRRLVRLLSAFG
jgi:pyruvate/2-oxoglutarate dehydrogenase complex dihydrolipoamide dehydrogenase (E3) component